jgi:hypothetical protein
MANHPISGKDVAGRRQRFARFGRAQDALFLHNHDLCRPCENGGGLKIGGGVAVGMSGIRHFPPKSAPDLA